MRLASMECERENTQCITLFLDLFNKALQRKTGNPQCKFNPTGFMVNENGANFNAIEKVLGKDVAECTVTCQWHFMSCGRNHIQDINMNEREIFKTVYQKICYMYTTRHDYDKTAESLQTICTRNSITNWWQWWEVWCFHIVLTFWGFKLSELNLAEAGNSSIRNKPRLPMSLAVAAWKDMLHMLLHDRDYEAFLTNTGKVSGLGLNLKERRAKFQKQEADFIDSCLECIQEGDMEKELEMEMNPEDFFPNKRAKHKVPENFDSANVVQKRKVSNENKKKNEAKKQKTTKNAITSEDEIKEEEEEEEAKKKKNKAKKQKRRKNVITSEDDSEE